jgi:ABC-2 type transport system ATP-binding protein
MNTSEHNLAVLTRGLTKSFGPLNAVNGLNLAVERGIMFGLVGPDGAGKSTVIRLLCGILSPTSGEGWVAGFNLERERPMINRQIGYLSQNFTLYGDLTVDENIEFFAGIHGVSAFKKRREELLEFTRLAPFRGRLAQALSGGMKKKLALACTLIHTPEIIFLDEPSTGVDPVARGELWSILSSIMEQGVTVFMTTPYLDEAERCRRICLMYQGRIVMAGTPLEIKQAMPGSVYDLYCSDAPAAYRLLRTKLPATSLVLYGDHLRIWSGDEPGAREAAVWLGDQRIQEIVLTRTDPSLEDAFVALLGTGQPNGSRHD